MTGDRAEDVLIARAENDVRAHAGRGLGHAPGGELGVPLTAALWLAAGHVPGKPSCQQDLPMRRDHRSGAASESRPGARGQRLSGALTGA